MKFVKYTLLTLLVLIVATFTAAWLYLEPIVKGAVHKYGTQIVGTEVNLDGFGFNPLKGEVSLKGLTVANPNGYKTPHLLNLGGVFVKVNPSSLLTNTIVVEDVRVSGPAITYEMPDFTTSNVMQIQQNVAKNTAASEKEAATVKAEEKTDGTSAEASKNVIIRRVLVENGSLSAMTPLQKDNEALTLDMPSIELTGIGEANHGVKISESITTIFNKILFNATSVVTKALGNASEMAKNAADAALANAKSAGEETAKGLLENVKFW